jgi:hypothetical protein
MEVDRKGPWPGGRKWGVALWVKMMSRVWTRRGWLGRVQRGEGLLVMRGSGA